MRYVDNFNVLQAKKKQKMEKINEKQQKAEVCARVSRNVSGHPCKCLLSSLLFAVFL